MVIATTGGAGVTPGGGRISDLGEHHLRDLAEPEHLYQLEHPGFALHELPPLATLDNRPNNLVEQPNRFIGRVKELAELDELPNSGQRLLTIIAPDGYGKSRICGCMVPGYGTRPFRSEPVIVPDL